METTLLSPFKFHWPPKLAKAPFDDSRADIILRSSDSTDFRVFKIILSLISPVLSEKFRAHDAARDPKVQVGDASAPLVIHIPEDSETLDLALRHCYPTRSPELSRLRDAQVLLEFARKYEVDALEPLLRKYLASATGKDPVGVYALASKYEHKDIASAAAKASLQLPLSRLTSAELPVTSITAEMYQQLIRYHSSCGEAATAVTLRRDWFPSGNKWLSTWPFSQSKDSSCCMMRDIVQDRPVSGSQLSSSRIAPRYLWSYLHRSALVLAHHPSVAAVTTEEFVLKDLDCSVCVNFRRTDMLEFSRVFGAEIKKVIEQVSFTEKGAISKTISSASLSTSATSAFVAEIKKGREQVPFTKKGSGGETITLASSFTSSTSQNSATTASTSSVLSPKKPLDITSPSCVKTQPSSKESA